MGLFGRKRSKFRNDAGTMAVEPPRVMAQPPRQVTITEPANPWPIIIVILIVATPFFLALFWKVAVFVMRNAGFRNPEQSFANTLIVLSVIALVLLIVHWFFKVFLSSYFEHSERMEQYRLDALKTTLEAERYRQLTAQAQPVATNGRLTDDDKRWCQLVTAVMLKAYDYYAASGQYNGVARPWSRRNAMAIPLRDGTTPTEAEAGRVRGWLEEKEIVKNDQINIDRFPDLNAVLELLNRLYHMPIQITAGNNTLLRTNDGYVPINEN